MKDGKKAVWRWVRGYVEQHPDATVDQIARDAEKAGMDCAKSDIGRIRKEALAARPQPVIPGVQIHDAPPRVAAPPPAPAPVVPPDVVAAMAEQPDEIEIDEDEAKADPAQAMKDFLNKLVDAQPAIAPVAAQAAIHARFGQQMNAPYLYETLRTSREIHGLPQIIRRVRKATRLKQEQEANARLRLVGGAHVAEPCPTALPIRPAPVTPTPIIGPTPPPPPSLMSKIGASVDAAAAGLPQDALNFIGQAMRAAGIVDLLLHLGPDGLEWTATRTTNHGGKLKL